MAKKLGCSELAVKDCGFTASGETDGDVVAEMVKHLRDEHEMKLPDADAIMSGRVGEGSLEHLDKDSSLVVQRMIKKLGIVPEDNPDLPKPMTGRTTTE